MRHRFWLFTVVALLLGVLGAAAADKAVTLQWATWGPAPIDHELIAAFEEAYPDIKIEYIGSTYSEHHPKLKVLAAGGLAPDVYAVDGYYTAEFVNNNLIRSLDDLIARTPSIDMQDYFPVALLDVEHRGRIYGLPYISAPQYYVYNVEHMAEAGLPNPDRHWSREMFLEYMRKLTRSDGQQTVRWGTGGYVSWGSVWPWIWAVGGDVVDEADKRFLLAEPTTIEALQWVADLNLVHRVVGGDFERQTRSLSAMYPAGFPSVTKLERSFEWDVTLPPGGSGGQKGIWKANAMAISTTTDRLEEAWTFLQFLLGPTGPGHEIYVRNKRFPPQTRDRELWNIFQPLGTEPVSLREITLLYASDHGRPLPHLLQWDEIMVNTIGGALSRISSGAMSARMAIEQIRPLAERLIAAEP
ncbi:MAG: ABC transporter substrate-binding protein [Limnochordia bacterium]